MHEEFHYWIGFSMCHSELLLLEGAGPSSQCNYMPVKFQDSHGQYSVERIFTSVCSCPGTGQLKHIRHFHHHLLKFIWDDGIKGFTRLHGHDSGQTSLSQLHESCGFTANEQEQM